METRILILILFTMIALSGCGRSGRDMPLPDGESSPSDGNSSNSTSNGGGTSGGSSPGTGAVVKSGEKYSTNRGTNFWATQHQTLTLPSGEYFKGGTVYGSYFYILTSKYLNSTTDILKIYRVTPSSLSSTPQCSWYENNTVTGGLAVDGTYFYIFGRAYTNNFLRIEMASCEKTAEIYISRTPYYSITPTIAVDSGNLYFPGIASSGSPYSYALLKNPISARGYSIDVSETLTGEHSTNWYSPRAIALNSGNRWAVFSESYMGYTIWKFNSGGTATVGTLPTKVLNNYIYPSQAGFLSDGTFVLINYSYQIDFIYFDVSEF